MIKNTNKREEKRKFVMLFIFNLFMSIWFMATFVFNKHFSVDDYWLYYEQKTASLTDIQQNMRMFSGGLYYLLDILKINIVEHQMFFGIILIMTFAWVITKISMEVAKITKVQGNTGKFIFVNSGTLILFFNAAVSEYLYYSGVYVQWIIGILGISYGAIYISRERRVLLNWLVGVAALTITAGSYQTFLAQYAYIVMALIFMRNEGGICRRSVGAYIRAILAAIVAMSVNIFGVKILVYCGIIDEGSRMNFDWSRVLELVRDIIHSQRAIWFEGMGIYPNGVLALMLVFFVSILIYILCKRKVNPGEGVCLVLVLISGSCVMYAAQIMQGYIRVTNRGMYAIFGVYAVCIWIICYYLKDTDWKVVRQISICAVGAFLIYSNIKINEIALDVIKTNTVSKCYSEEINRRICNYESQNNIQVTKVGFCRDAFISYRYYDFIETSAYGDMCANPFLANWSSFTALNYYSGRCLSVVEVPDDIAEYYAELNWDEADWDNQLVFENDTVYICVF